MHTTTMMPCSGSLWQTRVQKRHQAISRDRIHLNERLDKIESLMSALCAKADGAFAARPDLDVERLGRVENRIDKLELLLLRTSLDDFKVLDKEVVALLPRCMSGKVESDEPEVEATPAKMTYSPLLEPTSTPACLNSEEFQSDVNELLVFQDTSICMHFDIYSEVDAGEVYSDICNVDGFVAKEKGICKDVLEDFASVVDSDKGKGGNHTSGKGNGASTLAGQPGSIDLDELKKIIHESAQQLRVDIVNDCASAFLSIT